MNVDERVPVELSGAKEFIAPLHLLLFSKQIRLFLGGGGEFFDERTKLFWEGGVESSKL